MLVIMLMVIGAVILVIISCKTDKHVKVHQAKVAYVRVRYVRRYYR